MQGHVLSQTTRQEIHLITCEAEDGAGVGAWRAEPVFPEHSAREMRGGEAEGYGRGCTVKRARGFISASYPVFLFLLVPA